MENESFGDLIKQAYNMLRDRSKAEADLIYYVAKMDSESRTAIIIAYQFLYEDKEKDVMIGVPKNGDGIFEIK